MIVLFSFCRIVPNVSWVISPTLASKLIVAIRESTNACFSVTSPLGPPLHATRLSRNVPTTQRVVNLERKFTKTERVFCSEITPGSLLGRQVCKLHA